MALAAFNVFDFDSIKAVSDASQELGKKIFIQFSASTVKYYGADQLISMAKIACSENVDNIIFHLDHCSELSLVRQCIDSGWDSVMVDFSDQSLDFNIERILEIKRYIGKRDIFVEGELGQIGGVEDGHGTDLSTEVSVEEVQIMVEKTGVDFLAVGIGNAHGFYKNTNKINIDLLKKIHSLIPKQKLVLHGGTGIEKSKIEEMKNHGIFKINISTELKAEYLNATILHCNSDEKYNMISLVKNRYEGVKKLALNKIVEFS